MRSFTMTSSGKRIALTGATGFMGQFLVPKLLARGYTVRVLLKKEPENYQPSISPESPFGLYEHAVVGDLTNSHGLKKALEGVDFVVHCAGLAHAFDKADEEPYQRINNHATQHLSALAAKQGVKRFIMMSSVRAQSGPTAQTVLTEDDPFLPTDAYGRSKRDAEIFLNQEFRDSQMDWVALRPVLTYGDSVKGNMARLIKMAKWPLPLPVGSLSGRRSVLSLENLEDAVAYVLKTDGFLRRSFLVADDEPLTLGEMIEALRKGMQCKAPVINFPESLLSLAACAFGKKEILSRIAHSLEVETTALKVLGWTPLHSSKEGLEKLGQSVRLSDS